MAHLVARAGREVRAEPGAELVLAPDLGVGNRLPEALGGRADVDLENLFHGTLLCVLESARYLSRNGIDLDGSSKIVMLANARVLGHVFDPLSVFWCFDAESALVCIVAEVHNTYGERHVYLLHPDASGVSTADKALHVSPFFDVSGRYEMRFELSPQVVSSRVTLHREGSAAFTATFRGRPTPATRAALVGQLIRKPLMPQQVSALIRMHGIWLWLRRLPTLRRPHHQPQEGV